MRLVLKYSLLLVSLLSWNVVLGQNASVTADRTEILIGEQVQLILAVPVPDPGNSQVKFPVINDTLNSAVEVVSKTGIDTIKTSPEAKDLILSQQLYITSFDSGVQQIPPFEFEINGTLQRTDPINLQVNTIPVDTTGSIKDLKPIYDVSLTLMDYLDLYWPYLVGGVALVGIIVLLIYYIRKRRRAPKPIPQEPPAPVIPPAEVALQRLQQIEKERIYEQGRIKAYYTEITDVLRHYLEQQFDIDATEQTSAEILNHLRFVPMGKENDLLLRQILMLADMVKFAKEIPGAAENEQTVKKSIRFVEQTKEVTYPKYSSINNG